MQRLLLSLFLPLAALLSAAGAAEEDAAKPVEIGVILPLSGDLALFGEKLRRGIELAQETYGGRVKLIFEDGENSNPSALSAFRKLQKVHGVRWIIGPFGPAQTLAVAPLARERILLMAISMCDERYHQFENVFCVYPSLPDQLAPLFEEFSKPGTVPASMAALIEQAEVTPVYDKELHDFAARNHTPMLYFESFPSGTLDLRSYLARIKKLNPDLLVVLAWPSVGLELLRQIRELRLSPRLLWYMSELDADIIRSNAPLFEGVYFAAVPAEAHPEFTARFKKRWGTEPDLYHSAGHDAAACLMQALTAAPKASLTEITKTLISSPCRGTANPGFHFDGNRAVKLRLGITRARNGKQIRIESSRKLSDVSGR